MIENPPKIVFKKEKDKKTGKALYHSATISLNVKKKDCPEESAYLRLLDLFFRPLETFGEEQFL